MRIGAHFPMHHSKLSQERFGADVAQILLGSPQRWGQTKLPKGEVAAPLYVHAPYLINLSSHNKEVLLKSRQTLWQQTLCASELGALGVVIHGGSWKKHHSKGRALKQWEMSFNRPFHVKVLIENSANGRHSMTRYLKDLEELWTVLPDTVGFCLDTCHLWASGEWKDDYKVIEEILHIVGKIDLVHANGSKVERGSGQDRHSPLATSTAPKEWVAEIVLASGVEDVIAETTDPAVDIAILRELLDDIGCEQAGWSLGPDGWEP